MFYVTKVGEEKKIERRIYRYDENYYPPFSMMFNQDKRFVKKKNRDSYGLH